MCAVACCSALACGGAQKTAESKTGYAAYVVQLHDRTSRDQIRSLSLLGLRGDGDNNAGSNRRVYRMTEDQLEKVRALSFVVVVERLRPADKYDAAAFAAAGDPVLVTIDTFEHLGNDAREAVAAFIKQKGAVIRWVSNSTLRAEVAKTLIPQIAALDPVLWIEAAAPHNGPGK